MKLILGFIVFVVLVAATGGVYLFVRKDEQKQADRTWLKSLPARFGSWLTSVHGYLVKLLDPKPRATIDHPPTESTPAAA